MTEEPTMATVEEAAQRVYAKKLATDRESKKRKRAEELQEQQKNRHIYINKLSVCLSVLRVTSLYYV